MATMQSYNYIIEATYFANGKESTILSESIQSLLIKYDFITKNMPILYLSMKIKTDLYNVMVKNADNGTITLTIYKFIKLNGMMTKKSKYMQRMFSYFIPSDLDYNKSLDSEDTNSNSYKVCTLGLYDMEIVNRNNLDVSINTIITNSDMQSIVHYCTTSLDIIVEPFKDNEKLAYCIIPPIDTVKMMLQYLNSVHNFYNTGYLFFRDFEKTYLLSREGNAVGVPVDQFKTIIIKIMDTVEYQTKMQSIEIDNDRSAYVLYIDANFINMRIDRLKDKKYHKLLGIDGFGNSIETELDIAKNENGTEKVKLQRLNSGNMEYINTIKDKIEEDALVLNIKKTEIDTDILTPNREYLVQNFSSYSEYDGRYLLIYKRDIMVQQNGDFISNTIIGLKKI